MGIFDRFRNKDKAAPKEQASNIEQQKQETASQEQEVNTAGWDAITAACEKVYPTQKNPKHYGTLIDWQFGGNDPLEGISGIQKTGSFHITPAGVFAGRDTGIYG